MCVMTAITLGNVLAYAATAATVAAAVGGVMATVGAVQQADEREKMAKFQAAQEAENARLARKEAEAIKVMGDQEKAQLRQKMLNQVSAGRTGYASGGVVLGSGTTLDYEADIADVYDFESRNLEYDIESRQWQKQVAAANHASQSAMYRASAKAANQSKTTSLLTGVFGTIKDTSLTAIKAYGAASKAGDN
jgi:hypothetical protein